MLFIELADIMYIMSANSINNNFPFLFPLIDKKKDFYLKNKFILKNKEKFRKGNL